MPKQGSSAAGRGWSAAKAEKLRLTEKAAGNTRWALEGAGARRKPPTPERAEALRATLEREQALVAELRAERDAAKAAAS
jgi:hypothetical protein